jgi:hypothetical protein
MREISFNWSVANDKFDAWNASQQLDLFASSNEFTPSTEEREAHKPLVITTFSSDQPAAKGGVKWHLNGHLGAFSRTGAPQALENFS